MADSFYLNAAQAKGLADFFFDVAKGLVLGGVGFATTVPLEFRLIFGLLVTIFTYACIRIALYLLKEVET